MYVPVRRSFSCKISTYLETVSAETKADVIIFRVAVNIHKCIRLSYQFDQRQSGHVVKTT